MGLTESVVQLASYADVGGLRWEELNATGNGILQSPEYVRRLNATWDRFYATMASLSIPQSEWEGTSPAAARKAWDELSTELGRRSGEVLDAMQSAELSLAYDRAVELKADAVRGVVVTAAAVANANMISHETGIVRFAVQTGQLDLNQAEADADNLVRLMECIILLDDYGVLSALKTPVSGMGEGCIVLPRVPNAPLGVVAVPVIGAGYLALVMIAAIFAVAGAVVYIWSVSEANAERREWCLDDNMNLREGAPEWCLREPPKDPLADALARGGESLGKALGYGLVAVAGITLLSWALPRIAAKRAARIAA